MKISPVLRNVSVLALSASHIMACVADTPDRAAVVRRDSAGIEIIENSGPSWAGNAAWKIDAEPVLSIGDAMGDSPYLFSDIAGAVRLQDGSIIVADGESRQIRLFDANGRIAKAVGRSGTGPSEFRYVEGMELCGDGIWVQDGNRVSVWTTTLEYRREFRSEKTLMWPFICFNGAGVLTKDDVGIPFGSEPLNAIYGDSLRFFILLPDSTGERTHITTPLWEYIIVKPSNAGGGRGFTHPFGRRAIFAAYNSELRTAGAHGVDIRTYSQDGKLVRIVRGPPRNLSLTESILSNYRNARLERRDSTYRDLLSKIEYPMPPEFPAYSDIRIDEDGNSWVKPFSAPGATPHNRWTVFSSEGTMLGDVDLPMAMEILRLGSDHLIANVRDSLDVEHVQVYRIHKAGQ